MGLTLSLLLTSFKPFYVTHFSPVYHYGLVYLCWSSVSSEINIGAVVADCCVLMRSRWQTVCVYVCVCDVSVSSVIHMSTTTEYKQTWTQPPFSKILAKYEINELSEYMKRYSLRVLRAYSSPFTHFLIKCAKKIILKNLMKKGCSSSKEMC